jgi:glycosyltransferase involved in cell wall biosynthesis
MNSKLLSIIVTAHNSGKYLAACLESLTCALGDKLDLCEILLINDSSSDDSEQIYDSFSAGHNNMVKYNVHFKNIGKVRNFAVNKCSGRYITMLDGDDLLLKSSFNEILDFLEKNNPDMLITKLNEVKEDHLQCRLNKFSLRRINRNGAIKEYLIHKSFQAHFIGKFVKKEILQKYKFPEFTCYEDSFLFLEVLQHCEKIYYSSTGPYVYIKRSDSLSNNMDENKIKLYQITLDRMNVILGNKYKSLQVCHWIDFVNRYHDTIALWGDRARVKQCLANVKTVSFMLDPFVRLSYKRKLLKVRKITKAW